MLLSIIVRLGRQNICMLRVAKQVCADQHNYVLRASKELCADQHNYALRA